jgi:hypothetical protein
MSRPSRASVVPVPTANLAAEHPVAPGGVHQDQRDGQKRTDEREAQALRRAGGGTNRDVRRDDVRPQASEPRPVCTRSGTGPSRGIWRRERSARTPAMGRTADRRRRPAGHFKRGLFQTYLGDTSCVVSPSFSIATGPRGPSTERPRTNAMSLLFPIARHPLHAAGPKAAPVLRRRVDGAPPISVPGERLGA